MSLFIYQIGTTVFNVQSTNVESLKINLERKFRGGVTQSLFGPKTYFTGVRQLPDVTEVSIQGTIVCANGKSVSDQINEIMSAAGKPYVPVIAFLPNYCCDPYSDCGICAGCARSGVTWLTTTAFITSVKRTTELDDKKLPSMVGASVEITMNVDTYWHPLNPYIWDVFYGVGGVSSFRRLTALARSFVPTKVQSHNSQDANEMVFSKKNYENWALLYDPQVWADLDEEYGVIGYWSTWASYRVNPDRAVWSAPPGSVYAFTNCPTSGNITITVESEVTPFETYEHSSVLDLAELNISLNNKGLTGVNTDDIIIASDALYTPGFIIRANQVITVDDYPVMPKWSMEFPSPGLLLGNDNWISLSTPASVQSAFLHTHRLL